jgi:hypothetical protein
VSSKKKTQASDDAKSPNLSFSFQYYDTDNNAQYCLSDWAQADIKYTLSRLKEMCSKPIIEMIGKQTYHFFQTNWGTTIYKDGFPDPIKALNELEPFHFSIVGLNNQKARVFGALSGSTFYIAWFDYEHKILPVALKHT